MATKEVKKGLARIQILTNTACETESGECVDVKKDAIVDVPERAANRLIELGQAKRVE
jgi:hypothetical protein